MPTKLLQFLENASIRQAKCLNKYIITLEYNYAVTIKLLCPSLIFELHVNMFFSLHLTLNIKLWFSNNWKPQKNKAYILKYKAHISKYMPCIFCEVPYVFFFPLQYISQAVNSSSCLYCFYGISLLSQVLSPYLHVNCV